MEQENQPVFEDDEQTAGWMQAFVHANFDISFYPMKQLERPLEQDWSGFSFAHPPHSESQVWCEKAAREAENGHFSVLMLPLMFNSCYWRNTVYRHATEIRVFVFPVKKPGAKKQINAQMGLVVFAGVQNREADYPYPPIWPVEAEGWADKFYARHRNKLRFGN